MDTDMKNRVRFQKAYRKYRNGTTLTREDLMALITKTKLATNAAHSKKYGELSLQWEDRKHRLNDFVEFIQPEKKERNEIMNVEQNFQVQQVPRSNEEQIESI
jgi:phosphoserine aminotransferase